MPQPVSRRQFLGTSAGSAVALSSGPLLVQADALPSQTVTVGIMGLNRGMQVIAAMEKQPGVVIKYVCDVDSKRADQAKAKADRGTPGLCRHLPTVTSLPATAKNWSAPRWR